ncbi:hypothetical protein LO762_02960 [Actinocorallia sp. API 0066]|nr:DUF6879 family protein [Actinocorallia sp. API 0066]MCD0448161.1 hypothetical protein [Actinocorallia sp. API 0066]
MDLLSFDELHALFPAYRREALHLEMRDSYGTETELPHLARWAAGEPDDLAWLDPWCAMVREGRAAGKTLRRARVVSEPLSTYQRWAFDVAQPMADAGEDIRWIPRRRVSTALFPGNDFWLFDDELVVFLVFAGEGLVRAPGHPRPRHHPEMPGTLRSGLGLRRPP